VPSERVTTGSEPRRWKFHGSPGPIEDESDPEFYASYYLEEGPGFNGTVEMVEVVEPGHDEQTELEELRAVLHRNGRPETAPELQADFERRREQAIKDWAPYVGHAKDGQPIYHEDTVAAVVEEIRRHAAERGITRTIRFAIANQIEERFKPSAPGGDD
jgi:hypothetical protein